MNGDDLLADLAHGEDSRRQFKRDVTNADALAAEMCALMISMSNLRNPALASHAFHMLPYRGLGSGIPRATAAWPDLELIDDRRGNQFKVLVTRPPPK